MKKFEVKTGNIEGDVRMATLTVDDVFSAYKALREFDAITTDTFDDYAEAEKFFEGKAEECNSCFFKSADGTHFKSDLVILDEVEVDEDGEFIEFVATWKFCAQEIKSEDE